MSKKQKNQIFGDEVGYAMPKRRKGNIVAFVVCLLIALFIWVYATNMEEKKKNEELSANTSTSVSVTVDADLQNL